MFSFFITLQDLQDRDQQQADFEGLLTADELAMKERVEFDSWVEAVEADTTYIQGATA